MTISEDKTKAAYLRPSAAIVTPPRAVVGACECGVGAVRPLLRIPAGVRRVVVLSNVLRGFPRPDLREGDLVIHCNRACHREEAMAVPGTRHWLFVRHGKGRGQRGRVWYAPPSFEGFERVVFVDDGELAVYRWRAEWRAAGRKSPTTGFIVANIVREVAPGVPLLLVGFDPGVDHGTTLWRGHDWAAEAAWYAERGFELVRPGYFPKLALLVCSCGQGKYRDLRQACRETWLSQLPPGVEYRFFVGADALLPDEPDVVCLPGVADTWDGLPEKIMAAIGWMYENMSFDFLGKVDDDTYLRADRLLPLLAPGVHLLGHFRDARKGCWGGAGYFMSREAAGRLLERKGEVPRVGYEDVLVTRKIMQLGYAVTDCPRLKQNSHRGDGMPESGNDIISAHQFKRPEQHYECYRRNKYEVLRTCKKEPRRC